MVGTYKTRAVCKDECDHCHRPIYPGETIAPMYYDLEGNAISALEAYNLGPTKFTSKGYCGACV